MRVRDVAHRAALHSVVVGLRARARLRLPCVVCRGVSKTDALIFDLDGTLWDTTETCALAWNDVLVRLGVDHRPMTADDVRAVTGQPHAEAIRRAFRLEE